MLFRVVPAKELVPPSASVPDDPVLLVDIREAARRLGIGRSTLYELIAEGDIEVVHIKRSSRVPVAALAEYVERLRDRTRRSSA